MRRISNRTHSTPPHRHSDPPSEPIKFTNPNPNISAMDTRSEPRMQAMPPATPSNNFHSTPSAPSSTITTTTATLPRIPWPERPINPKLTFSEFKKWIAAGRRAEFLNMLKEESGRDSSGTEWDERSAACRRDRIGFLRRKHLGLKL
jgi:hypothetical protein